MQRLSLIGIAASAMAFCIGAWSQTSNQVPGGDTSQATPAPIVIETRIDLRTDPGPPADMHAAREEAVNALDWAKTEGCRSDPSPRDCIAQAQAEYRRVMSELAARR
jgi:hypothetical protein